MVMHGSYSRKTLFQIPLWLCILILFSIATNLRFGTVIFRTDSTAPTSVIEARPFWASRDSKVTLSDSLSLDTNQNTIQFFPTNTRGVHSTWHYPVAHQASINATRAIALLSMGPGAASSTLVERCIVSIRKRGKYLGPILLLTDSGRERYQELTEEDPLLIVMAPLTNDWNWDLRRDLPYKRFKTFLLEYLDRDPRLQSVELVYYLDIDIVVGQPLQKWFSHIEDSYPFPRPAPDEQPVSQIILFEGNISPLQGGQFVIHRENSQPCLDLWRYYMDANPKEHKDQPSLTQMWEDHRQRQKGINQTAVQSFPCSLVRMKQEPHLVFVTVKEMSVWKLGDGNDATGKPAYPTLMHIKNTHHASTIPEALQQSFFQHLLGLPPDRMLNLTSRRRIRPNRTWSALQVQGGA